MSTKKQHGELTAAEVKRAGWEMAGEIGEQDAELKEVLSHFKQSVDAWSAAVYARPRTVEAALEAVARRRSWRLAAGWAMALVLVAGGVSGGVFEHVQRQQAAQRAAAAERAHEQERAAAERRQQDQKLMATVDTDISQEVPSAMEPLAELMEDGAAK